MNSPEQNPPIEQDLLELLVDGELSDSQRRDLLASLDQTPDGWRRCALAFLEDQCWKQELRHLPSSADEQRPTPVQQPAPTPPRVVRPSPQRPRPRYAGRLGTFLAMAASFVVALVIGNQIRLGDSDHTPSGPASFTQVERPAVPSSATPEDPWRMVTLTSNDSSGGRQSVRLPAREGDRLDPSWWQPSQPVIPDDVLRALKASGHEIRQSRQLLPVPMQDGRKLVVPVDQVDVDCVDRPKYQ